MTGADRRITARGARFVRLVAGTVAMGLGIALLVRARLGLLPLDVLHAAISRHTGWTMGGAFLAVQAVLLLAYLPLRVRPGVGTVVAATVPAVVCDVALALLPDFALVWRLALLPLGGVLFALGIALYLGAGMGALPRDGLMLELHCRRPWLRPAVIRVVADVACLLAGWLALGPVAAVTNGTVGLGSVLLAGLLGPVIAILLRRTGRFTAPGESSQDGQASRASGQACSSGDSQRELVTQPLRPAASNDVMRDDSRTPATQTLDGVSVVDLAHNLKR
ncbi:YczE/YyaS/YitT family protein [Saccharothrix isguenensis]